MPRILIILTILLLPQWLLAQRYVSDAEPIAYFQSGMDLLDKQKYSAARQEFETYLEKAGRSSLATEAEYYVAYTALLTYNADGEARLSDFIKNHAAHPKALRANYELGNFYFRDNNYKKTIAYLEKADEYSLTQEERDMRNFKLGYAYLAQKQFDQSKPYFDQVKTKPGSYNGAANYYAGYISFRNGNYAEALSDLRKAGQEESYAENVPFLIASIYYKQKKYDELISYGEKALVEKNAKNLANINLLLGEAYYGKKAYNKAAQYFETYAAQATPRPEERYRMAFAQYKSANKTAAIDNFKQIASQDDSIGQFASYYLGVLYVDQDNQPFATSAFERAADMKFDEDIREQASFNLGKVYFAREDFSQAIKAFTAFKEAFPNSRNMVEVNDLLSESYLNTQNYQQAIAFIESLPNKTAQIRKAYQKVSFFAGTQAFNNSDFYKSVQLFDKSLEYPVDLDLVVGTDFWKGEAYSTGKKYEEAAKAYQDVFDVLGKQRRPAEGITAMYQLKSHYGLGYALFNTKQYKKSLEHFQAYTQGIQQQYPSNPKDKLFYSDAMIRLADCYYVTKSYAKAIDTYQQAISNNNQEISYAYYQIGVIQSIQGKTKDAKNSFDVVINRYADSRYADDAAFQKSQANFQEGNYQEAVQGFSKIIKVGTNTNLVPYALLRRAVAYTNQKQYKLAAADYKQILDKYMGHTTANSALLGLQEVISLGGGSASEMNDYVARYREANPNDQNLANIEFESAKNLYFSQKYDLAVEKLLEFTKNYPNNANTDEARFYVGESFYRADQTDKALEVYYQIAAKGTSSRLSRAIQRIAELEQAKGSYQQAITYYKKLETLARNKREQFEAWSGLMTSYFELGMKGKAQMDSVEMYADLILKKGNVSARAENMALLYKGKAAYEIGDYEQATDQLLKTLNAAKDIYGAEAQYLLASIQYKQKKYAESIETLYDLNKNFSLYEYWLGRSFLLIADNYIALEENFQAKATLESLIENSPLSDIVKEAKQKLRLLKDVTAEQERKQKAQDSLKQQKETEDDIPQDSAAQDSVSGAKAKQNKK